MFVIFGDFYKYPFKTWRQYLPNSKIRDRLDPLQTTGIYQMEYSDKENKKGYYIGVTKRKIKERIYKNVFGQSKI